jgi:L-lactate dehydrogenase
MLSKKMKIHPDDLRAYVLGEHGDSQFPVFSMAVAGGTRIVENDATMEVFHKTMRAGFDVVSRKGHTSYAISMAAVLVIEAMAWDTHKTMPLSILIEGFQDIKDICLSLPVVVGKNGVSQVLEPELGQQEKEAFHRCATIVRDAIKLSIS